MADTTTTTTTGPASGMLIAERGEARLTTESKAGFKTTEFFVMLATIAAILISAAVISSGDTGGADPFTAKQAWLYVAIVASAYIVSRGLAKSGTAEPYWESGSNRIRGNEENGR